MLDLIWDALLDTAKLLPFLYLTYLAMEHLEHRWKGKSSELLRRAGRLGPLWGGLIGIVPQCGFSAAAAGLYAGRVVSLGTLLAVFLSTSDEMLPLLLSSQTPVSEICKILGLKAAIGVVCGFLADAVFRRPGGVDQIGGLCEKGHCGCAHRGVFAAALRHTAQIGVFLLLVDLALGLLLGLVGQDTLRAVLTGHPVLSVFLAALVGLIPNCAASVALTALYVEGLLSFGSLMAGLLVGAGVGLLVLFRTNRHLKENLAITGILYTLGVLSGGTLELLGI